MNKRIAFKDLGITSTPWKTATSKNRVYVSVMKNGAVIDAFLSDKDRVRENVERMYGKDVQYKF